MKKDKDLQLNYEITECEESQQQAEAFQVTHMKSTSQAGGCGLFKAIFMLRMVYGYSFHYVIEKLQHK